MGVAPVVSEEVVPRPAVARAAGAVVALQTQQPHAVLQPRRRPRVAQGPPARARRQDPRVDRPRDQDPGRAWGRFQTGENHDQQKPSQLPLLSLVSHSLHPILT